MLTSLGDVFTAWLSGFLTVSRLAGEAFALVLLKPCSSVHSSQISIYTSVQEAKDLNSGRDQSGRDCKQYVVSSHHPTSFPRHHFVKAFPATFQSHVTYHPKSLRS